MSFEVLFTGMAVSDFSTARRWYERFFGRPADVIGHEHEVMWRVTDSGWLYILRDPIAAGGGIAAMAVADIEAATSALRGRGVAIGPIAPEGETGRKALVIDPDGNSIALLQVTAGS